MANISGASLTQIQQRLRDTPAYHPFDADTFCDWAMEAGDIVTVRRGEESYQSPIHSSHLVWRGKQNMELNASGTKERDAIARVSKQKYARGGYGMRQQKSLYYEFYSEDGYLHGLFEVSESHMRSEFEDVANSLRGEFEVTASHLRSEFNDTANSLRGEFEVTASHLRSEFNDTANSLRGEFEVTASGLRSEFEDTANSLRGEFEVTASHLRGEFNDAANSLRGEFEVTASHLRGEFEDANNSLRGEFEVTAASLRAQFEDTSNSLRSSIEAEAGRIGLVVEGYGADASVKRASIVLAINNGKSSTHIDADEVYIGNKSSTTVINGKLNAEDVTADYIQGKIANLSTLQVNGITSSGSVSFSGTTTLSGSVQIQGSDGTTRNLATGIRTLYKASESEGVVTLQYIDFNGATHDVTFNKAVATISGSWSDGTLTVSKDPNGSSTYSSVIDSVLANGQVTYANQILTVPVTVRVRNNGGSQSETGYSGTLAVGAGLAYTAGQNSVNVSAGSWSKGSITFSPSAGTGSSASTSIDAVLSNGTVTYSNKVLSVPIKVMAKVGSGSQTETGYTSTLSVGAGLAYDAGYGDAHLTGSWDKTTSSLTNNNRITISKTTSGSSNSLNYIVSAAASIEYNTTTHKYTATAKANVDGTQRGDDATATGGIEAYNAGLADEKTLVRTRFNYMSHSYYVEAYENTSSAPSISQSATVYRLGLSGTTVQIQDTGGNRITNTPTYSIPLEEKTITANSSTGYTPSSGYVGFSKVKVAVPNEHSISVSGFTSNGTTDPGSTFTNITGISSSSSAYTWFKFNAYCGSTTKSYKIKVSDTARTIVNNSNDSKNYQGTLTAGKYINLKNSTETGSSIVQSWYVPNAWFYAGSKPNTSPTVNEMASNDYYIWIEYHTPNGRVGSPAGNTVWHINVPSSPATLDYIGVDPNRPADSYILNGDKQPYVITSAKTTYWFLIRAMSGTTILDSKYLGVGTNVSSGGGGHNNAITFTRGALYAPNTYTWSAQVGTNVTGTATKFDFYY